MQKSLLVKLISFLLLNQLFINSVFSKNINNQFSTNELESILNQGKNDLLKRLFLQESFKNFDKRYTNFITNYKNTKWSIRNITKHPDKIILNVSITSSREIGDEIYNIKSNQTVKIVTFKNKIKSYKVLNEETILKSKGSPLIIEVISPNKVLTGERYEMNLIVKKPLDKSLIASGLIVLNNKDNKYIYNNNFGIKPSQSGGLYKYIQAPQEPGFQTISAIIAHPKGIYSITKKIKVDL